MKQKISMKIGTKRFIITLVILLSLTGYYWFTELKTPVLNVGTSVTTIAGTDKLSDSRSVINTNFASLNAGKMEYGTTTIPTLTTASALVTVGALSSGSLTTGFTTINVAQGGTGRASLNVNQVLLGNGVSGIDKVSGLGDSGQFLTSNGAGTPPTWQTSAVDTGIKYTWTDEHTFTASSSMLSLNLTDFVATTATSTNLFVTTGSITNLTSSGTQTLNGVAYTFPVTDGSASQVLSTNGSATLSFIDSPYFRFVASDTLVVSADTERSEVSSATYAKVKEVLVRTQGTIRVKFDLKKDGTNTALGRIYINGVAVGTERDTNSTSYVNYSEDISVEANDLVQLYIKPSANDVNKYAYTQNFRFYYTKTATDEYTINTN